MKQSCSGGSQSVIGEANDENDVEGLQTMKVLGQNMAWLLKKLHT